MEKPLYTSHSLIVFSWMALYNNTLFFQFLFDIHKTTCIHDYLLRHIEYLMVR